jgi:hypothetical protein
MANQDLTLFFREAMGLASCMSGSILQNMQELFVWNEVCGSDRECVYEKPE